jgi:hypothetical protein
VTLYGFTDHLDCAINSIWVVAVFSFISIVLLMPDSFPVISWQLNFKGSEYIFFASLVEAFWVLNYGFNECGLCPSIVLLVFLTSDWSDGVRSTEPELSLWLDGEVFVSTEIGSSLSTSFDVESEFIQLLGFTDWVEVTEGTHDITNLLSF